MLEKPKGPDQSSQPRIPPQVQLERARDTTRNLLAAEGSLRSVDVKFLTGEELESCLGAIRALGQEKPRLIKEVMNRIALYIEKELGLSIGKIERSPFLPNRYSISVNTTSEIGRLGQNITSVEIAEQVRNYLKEKHPNIAVTGVVDPKTCWITFDWQD